MITIPVNEIYQCQHCKTKHYSKGVMTRHEKWCRANPANWDACLDCRHCVVGETEVFYNPSMVENGWSNHGRMAKSFSCSKLNKKVYPTKVVKKRLPERYPETFADQERMPNKCNLHEFGSPDSGDPFEDQPMPI